MNNSLILPYGNIANTSSQTKVDKKQETVIAEHESFIPDIEPVLIKKNFHSALLKTHLLQTRNLLYWDGEPLLTFPIPHPFSRMSSMCPQHRSRGRNTLTLCARVLVATNCPEVALNRMPTRLGTFIS
jgi:hypothetical protein